VMDYRRRHPDFPHETTIDQFFSEEQFEVYRALGFHAARGLFIGRDKVGTLDRTAGLYAKDIRKAFDRLGLGHLLDPAGP